MSQRRPSNETHYPVILLSIGFSNRIHYSLKYNRGFFLLKIQIQQGNKVEASPSCHITSLMFFLSRALNSYGTTKYKFKFIKQNNSIKRISIFLSK